MNPLVLVLIVGMVLFAVVTAFRETVQYQRALQGDLQYLVSKQRRNRRLLISFCLLFEALFLFLGFFVIDAGALWFWVLPMLLIGIVVYLSLQDWKETRTDVDRIFKEAYRSAIQKVEQVKAEDRTEREN